MGIRGRTVHTSLDPADLSLHFATIREHQLQVDMYSTPRDASFGRFTKVNNAAAIFFLTPCSI